MDRDFVTSVTGEQLHAPTLKYVAQLMFTCDLGQFDMDCVTDWVKSAQEFGSQEPGQPDHISDEKRDEIVRKAAELKSLYQDYLNWC